MKIKKILAELLERVSDSMITLAPASWVGSGIEDMPESIKKIR